MLRAGTDHGGGAEMLRLAEDASRRKNWKRWGPYLSERQWGTVREDYSADGSCWTYFPHDHARSRAYRWGEDGLLGICDRQCRLCFALALWNGKDPILKERLFGLTGPEGNHAEDVKEEYFYLDSTPTHSYMRALYKYPHAEFPYRRLLEENRRRGLHDPEFELIDTGIFDDDRYFDVSAEYAKAGPEDLLIRITAANRGPEAATCHVLPTLWFRNTWTWGNEEFRDGRPRIERAGARGLVASHSTLGVYRLEIEPIAGAALELLFTENDTNMVRHWGVMHPGHFKDAFHERVVHERREAVNSAMKGTKAAAWHRLEVPARGEVVLRLRLGAGGVERGGIGADFEQVFAERVREADEFFAQKGHAALPEAERRVARQAAAGLLWNKQFYHYVVKDWLAGDPHQPPPPERRKRGRNAEWEHLYNRDILSMPDKWEYPWYAAWDTAFHMIPFAQLDPQFAKDQLMLFLREWYMHPNGQLPAYEFAFGDVNPPVHAWACWRVYKMTAPRGERDVRFLESCFQKLLLNFTWWVNRKDPTGRHLFAGGFLGLDNIGVFERSQEVPGGHLEQADGTAWMAFYSGTMLSMAMELARHNPVYEDMASKFFEHFIAITDAMNSLGGSGLWDEEDGFYYDQIRLEGEHQPIRLKVRSLVGLVPLLAAEVLEEEAIAQLPGFRKRMQWFIEHRPDLPSHMALPTARPGTGDHHRLLAVPTRQRLERVLGYLLDEEEFMSPYGIRSLSRVHERRPYVFRLDGQEHRVEYTPGESTTHVFGGNSNWRGPVWFPLNFLIIEALERYDRFYGDSLLVELPRGSGRRVRLREAADEIRRRLSRLFIPAADGVRPCRGGAERVARDPRWRDLVLFYEHFHPETGRGLGASHQTGWTALISPILQSLHCASHVEGRARG